MTNHSIMYAQVLEVNTDSLLVCDLYNAQRVQVNTDCACHFCPGDRVCIHYSGAMTMSLPPQISAIKICHTSSC